MNTMYYRTLLVMLVWLWCQALSAQPSDYPQDFLTKDFHKQRREALRQKLPANSVAVFFANSVKNRANDVDYIYHQDPDFFYLTGYQEPNGVLLIFTDMQKDAEGNLYNEILFTQRRDARREMYDGKRLGVEGAKEILGFAKALDGKEFAQFAVDFDKFNKVLFLDDPGDARDDSGDPADIHDLVKQFKGKANIPASYSAEKEAIYDRIRETDMDNLQQTINYLSRWARFNPTLLQDPHVSGFLQANSPESRKLVQSKLPRPIRISTVIACLL